jgi:hypothetical protein
MSKKTEQDLRIEWPDAKTPARIIPQENVIVYPKLTAGLELWSLEYAEWMWANASKEDNRNMKKKVNASRVKSLANDMTTGNFMVTGGVAIIIDWTGRIINGHHTTAAQISSKTNQVYMVTRGANPIAYQYLDIGMKRGTDQIIITNERDKKGVAAVGRMLCIYDSVNGDERFGAACLGGDYASQQEVIRYAPEHAEEISEAINFCTSSRTQNYGAHSVLATTYALFARHDKAKAQDFMNLLFSGEGLGTGHPIYYLRKRLIDWRMRTRTRMTNDEIYALLFITWKHYNNYVDTGKTVTETQIRWRKDQQFPVLKNNNKKVQQTALLTYAIAE